MEASPLEQIPLSSFAIPKKEGLLFENCVFRLSALGILHLQQQRDDEFIKEDGAAKPPEQKLMLPPMTTPFDVMLKTSSQQLQQLLRVGSFLGTSFHQQVLGYVIDEIDIPATLAMAEHKGWLVASNDEEGGVWWRFANDRIHASAYENDEIGKGRETLHLEIGTSLWKPLVDQDLPEDILEPKVVAQQLVQGSRLITDQEQCYAVARLLLRVGESEASSKSKQDDFTAAYHWLNQGILLLSRNKRSSWRDEYDLSLALYNAAAEVAYCIGKFDAVEELSQAVQDHSRNPLDKLRVSTLLVYKLGTQNDLHPAMEKGLEIDKDLKVGFPPRGGVLSVPFKFTKIKRLMGRMSDNDILQMPPLTDENILGAMRVLVIILEHAIHSRPMLVPQITFWVVEVVLTKGMSVMSSDAMAALGLLCCMHFNEFDLGQRAAHLSLKVLKMHEGEDYMARCATPIYMFCFPFTDPLESLLQPMFDAAQMGLARGDIDCAMLCASLHTTASLIAAIPLSVALPRAHEALELMKAYKQERSIVFTQGSTQMMQNLLGQSADPRVLTGEYISFDQVSEECKRSGNLSALGGLYQAQIGLDHLFEEFERAEKTSSLMAKCTNQKSHPPFLLAGQYGDEAVAALALCRSCTKSQRRRRIRFAKQKLKALQNLCQHTTNSASFLPYLFLVQGEMHATQGNTGAALDKFAEALELSMQQNCHLVSGLTRMRTAAALLDAKRTDEAKTQFREAIKHYSAWEAVVLVEYVGRKLASVETSLLYNL